MVSLMGMGNGSRKVKWITGKQAGRSNGNGEANEPDRATGA